METLKLIYDEKKVAEIAEKILDSTKEKIKEQIANEYYKELDGYLYEHYTNNKDRIKKEMIKEISDEYVANPSNYQFGELRKKIFEENKDAIVGALTDDAIFKNMDDVLREYTHRNSTWGWRWKDGIVNLIKKNWDLFKDDERIVSGLGREIENLKYQNKQLQERLSAISGSVNEDESDN
jgi:hypothetical protein